MKIINTNERLPRWGMNVFVKYTLHHQDFWTRGFLANGIWTVMLWDGKITVLMETITQWMEIPNIEA